MEPWDGPASISFTDGKMIGATLDRNGLASFPLLRYHRRPRDHGIRNRRTCRLIQKALIKEKGRLQPGKMFVVDMEQGRSSVMMN
jgi:glutamate synthase (NADPH/NADH) large chain